MFKKIILSVLGLTLFAASAVFPLEPLERIVAIVGSEPILLSELALQMQLLAINQGIRPKNERELKELQNQILEQMISEQLFVLEAKNDTNIVISANDIDRALDNRIASVVSQYPSEDAFLEELAREGLNFRAFKNRLRPEIENQLYKQSWISSKLRSISISRQEVVDFYNKYTDSIPTQPDMVRLAHILLQFAPSKATEDSIRQVAEKVRKNVTGGADFASMAMEYSDGPAALNGGDLGFLSEDDVLPQFGRTAFNLQPGEISGVVKTEAGFHIINCIERVGNRSHLRQILFEITPTAADSQLIYYLADSLMAEITDGTDFREIAKVYSADDESRRQGGELGWYPLKELPSIFVEAIDKFKDTNDVVGPIKSEYGLHLLKLLDRQEARTLSLEDDYDSIREMARQNKTGEYVDKWIAEIREKTYVEVRPLD